MWNSFRFRIAISFLKTRWQKSAVFVSPGFFLDFLVESLDIFLIYFALLGFYDSISVWTFGRKLCIWCLFTLMDQATLGRTIYLRLSASATNCQMEYMLLRWHPEKFVSSAEAKHIYPIFDSRSCLQKARWVLYVKLWITAHFYALQLVSDASFCYYLLLCSQLFT
jgi:hypothetical protein